ncbi:MAG: hypothetical protein WA862_06365 [Solirubrobacterales bacterium]
MTAGPVKQEDLELLAVQCADLLNDTGPWIHRRKEAVSIIDESALKRQLSVDFTLCNCPRYAEWAKLVTSIFGDKMAAAPLFFLEKRPAWLMGFDLKDEGGRSLPLMTSGDNAILSGAMLEHIGSECLGKVGVSLSPAVARMLNALARGSRAEADRWLNRLQQPLPSDNPEDQEAMSALWGDDDMRWWLMTLAESSVVLVVYEESSAHRRILKLAYDEPLGIQPKPLARFGWAPFKTWIVSPFIEGERYHLEVRAPRGMRLTRAALADDEHPEPNVDNELTRRAHLYVDDASRSGGAIADIWLRVSGQGFLGGATLSSLLVLMALAACVEWSHEIAENPTSAPALLLLLPAVIASYVGRPGQHPLTAHLLAIPRWALLGAGGAAYYAAIRLALVGVTPDKAQEVDDRAATIESWLTPPLVIAGLAFLVLLVGWIVSRSVSHRAASWVRNVWDERANEGFQYSLPLATDPGTVMSHCTGELEPALISSGQRSKATRTLPTTHRYRVFRTSPWINWVHDLQVQPGAAGTSVTRAFIAKSKRLPRWAVALYVWLQRRQARRLDHRLSEHLGD